MAERSTHVGVDAEPGQDPEGDGDEPGEVGAVTAAGLGDGVQRPGGDRRLGPAARAAERGGFRAGGRFFGGAVLRLAFDEPRERADWCCAWWWPQWPQR